MLTGKSGGTLEIQAMSKMLNCSINIYSESDPFYNCYNIDCNDIQLTLFEDSHNQYSFGVNQCLIDVPKLTNTSAFKNTFHGDLYQIWLLILFIIRGRKLYRDLKIEG
jgi:hypothetical protein